MQSLPDEVAEALEHAAPAGLRRVAPRRWVSEPTGAIRRIVELAAIKGGQYSARWGFSVDFVPVLRGDRLAWKRTPSTADFDICIDPIDLEGAVPRWCSFSGEDGMRHISGMTRRVRNASAKDFAGVQSLTDLNHLFERRSRMTFRRFSLDNYVQTDLAWGLIEIATGRPQDGAARLSGFCARYGVDPAAPALAKAAANARSADSLTD